MEVMASIYVQKHAKNGHGAKQLEAGTQNSSTAITTAETKLEGAHYYPEQGYAHNHSSHGHGEADAGHSHSIILDARIERRLGTYVLELGVAMHR